MPDYNLSVSDLMLIDGFAEAFGTDNTPVVMTALFANGMDTEQEVEEVVCTHRNLQGDIVNCMRYEGSERLDDEWIRSGVASLEAIIDSSKDPHMRVALRVMSKERGSGIMPAGGYDVIN